MLKQLTSNIVNQVIVPGSLFWKRHRRSMIRRWKRAMLLPETVILAALIIFGSMMADNQVVTLHAGQQALAAGAASAAQDSLQDGLPGKRKQRILQDKLRSNPENILTLTGYDVLGAFQYADLHRTDGDMAIMQFRGEKCVLDVFTSADGRAPVHYEIRRRHIATLVTAVEEGQIKPRDCVIDILKSRRV